MTGDDDIRKAIDQLRATMERLLEKMVRKDVYESDQRGIAASVKVVADDVEKLEKRQDKTEKQRADDKRLLIAAFIAPLLLLLLQLYFHSQGIA